MKIWELLNEEHIFTNFECENKHDFLEKAATKIAKHYSRFNVKSILNKFLEREETMTTGIGKGIAVPHIIYDKADKLFVFVFKLKQEIDFKSLDKKPVKLAIMIIGNNTSTNMQHLQLLAKIARSMKNDEFVNSLTSANTAEEILNVFKKYE
jgi:fructose-specific phosphotransferase system IIA component